MNTDQIMLPKTKRILVTLGENIRLARLRRKLSAEQLSERAGIGRMTLYKIENGSAVTAIGNYLQVLFILGLENDFAKVASDDPLGRKLQDLNMTVRKRAPRRKTTPDDQ